MIRYQLIIKQGSVEIRKTFGAPGGDIPDTLFDFCKSVLDQSKDAELQIIRQEY